MATVAQACERWQSGRDSGSSPIRAAARILTGTRHYFEAPFIDNHEIEAAANPVTLDDARTLLGELAKSDLQDASGWAAECGVLSNWVGRGIKRADHDDQIVAALRSGQIAMPLWGASFDKEVAKEFGSRFIFELSGHFPAIPVWVATGSKAEERELILGGRYSIISMVDEAPASTRVSLEFMGLIPPLTEASAP